MPEHKEPEKNRRSKLVFILLLSSAVFALLCLFVYIGLALFSQAENLRLHLVTVLICTGGLLIAVPVIGVINHYYTPTLSASLFLLILFALITIFNLSGNFLDGYGLFWFSIPIVFASFILFSSASFISAGISSLVLSFVALGSQKIPNFMAITGFFIIALISFLSVKSMENIVKKLQNVMHELQEELEEKKRNHATVVYENKAQNLFITKVTHDIRTPMSAILGISKYLSEHHAENLNLDQKDGLVMIHQSCKKLLLIVNEVMELFRIEAGEIEVQNQSFPLRGLITELKDSINSLIDQKDVIIYFQVDSNLPDNIHSDRQKLYQGLFSLISNLIKLAGHKELIIHVHQTGTQIFFDLKVVGTVIAKKQVKYLFNNFQVEDQEEMEGYSSIGIGLSLCRKIVEILGGTISTETKNQETLIQFIFSNISPHNSDNTR